MHHRTSDRSLPNSAALALALLIAAGLGLHARGADPSPEKPAEPSKLAKDLIGTWVLVGTPDKIADAPNLAAGSNSSPASTGASPKPTPTPAR